MAPPMDSKGEALGRSVRCILRVAPKLSETQARARRWTAPARRVQRWTRTTASSSGW